MDMHSVSVFVISQSQANIPPSIKKTSPYIHMKPHTPRTSRPNSPPTPSLHPTLPATPPHLISPILTPRSDLPSLTLTIQLQPQLHTQPLHTRSSPTGTPPAYPIQPHHVRTIPKRQRPVIKPPPIQPPEFHNVVQAQRSVSVSVKIAG